MLSSAAKIDILCKSSKLGPTPFLTGSTMGDNKKILSTLSADPAFKKKMDAYLASSTSEQREENVKTFMKFVRGEITWAEIRSIPKSLLKFLAEVAYDKFKFGDYQTAEILFKGLSILDHKNWYYRSALGAIYQKQKLLDEAIEEYDMALMLEDSEPMPWVNRGECSMLQGHFDEAEADFKRALDLDKEQKSHWGRRAKTFLKVVQIQRAKQN